MRPSLLLSCVKATEGSDGMQRKPDDSQRQRLSITEAGIASWLEVSISLARCCMKENIAPRRPVRVAGWGCPLPRQRFSHAICMHFCAVRAIASCNLS
ncbi:uncharacterized protein PgNI_01630 [Pyricularia grisea]|nr:uncharacterized protein PgNI_01630 [Pyricularia grisea]TLD17345.1 hypothetical protein PgNI_01630 [Pyricularia grisea]